MKLSTFKKVVALIIILWAFLVIYIQKSNAAGQQCNWQSDCSINEKCAPLDFRDRDRGGKRGICVPKRW